MPTSTARSAWSSSRSIRSSAKVRLCEYEAWRGWRDREKPSRILGVARNLQSRRWPCVRHSHGRASGPGARGWPALSLGGNGIRPCRPYPVHACSWRRWDVEHHHVLGIEGCGRGHAGVGWAASLDDVSPSWITTIGVDGDRRTPSQGVMTSRADSRFSQPPAGCRRAPPAASGPPRSRSGARRRCGSPGRRWACQTTLAMGDPMAGRASDVGGTFAPSSSPCGHDRHEQRWGRAAAREPTSPCGAGSAPPSWDLRPRRKPPISGCARATDSLRSLCHAEPRPISDPLQRCWGEPGHLLLLVPALGVRA